jgi:enamine deaminase RidA (YjgF/YER057c/UK114 family)
MERQVSRRHDLVNPESLPAPKGFSHAVAAGRGRLVAVAGQVAHDAGGEIVGESIEEQFDLAAANVVRALEAAGAQPEHVISLLIFTTDVDEYKDRSREVGAAYRRHFDRHFPATALLGVAALFDPEAKVELVATAVIPDGGGAGKGGEGAAG